MPEPDLTGMERFFAKWPDFIPGFLDAALASWSPESKLKRHYLDFLWLRDKLRLVWHGTESANELLADLLTSVEGYGDEDGLVAVHEILAEPDWKTGRFFYRPRTPLQQALYELMCNSRRAKVCGRPGCPAPYFVARDPRQQYCSTDCADAMQDEWRRRWWREHGNEWRKQSKKKRGKRQ